jgi:hypothetical protein
VRLRTCCCGLVAAGALLAACLLGGCAGAARATGQPAGLRYAGTLRGCGSSQPASLSRSGDSFAFAPGDGALVLRGTLAADGSFSATLNTQPAGKPAYLLVVQGRADAGAATLRYSTPRCAAATAVLAPVAGGVF